MANKVNSFDAKGEFKCPHCDKKTYSENMYRFHIKLSHPEKVKAKEAEGR